MAVHFEKRGEKFSFYFYDVEKKRNVRLRNNEVPAGIKTEEQAIEFKRKKEVELDATKIRILRQIEWKKKFYDFNALLEIYEKGRKIKAPNSWTNSLFYLEHYVFTFFLQEKECNNINNWALFFEDFKDWLFTVKPLKSGKKQLAVATMNHCIKTLNTFLETMARKRKAEYCRKCPSFPRSMLYVKGADHVIPPDVVDGVYRHLKSISVTAADMYYVSIHTGLRLNELCGLSLDDVFQGEPNHKDLKEAFAQFQITTYGYIVLESQPADPKIRDKNDRVPRKALKGKKNITAENCRTIPITDKETFNILVKRWKTQKEGFQKGLHGRDKKDYLLFEGMNKNRYSSLLRRASAMARVKYYSPHDARHTFSTNFVSMVFGNMILCQMVLGHASNEVTRRYVHLHEQIQRKMLSDRQVEQGMEYVS